MVLEEQEKKDSRWLKGSICRSCSFSATPDIYSMSNLPRFEGGENLNHGDDDPYGLDFGEISILRGYVGRQYVDIYEDIEDVHRFLEAKAYLNGSRSWEV